MKRTLKPNEYQCALCQNVYTKGWSEEKAMQEARHYWPWLTVEECAILCDDCYEKLKPEKNRVRYLQSLWYQRLLNEAKRSP